MIGQTHDGKQILLANDVPASDYFRSVEPALPVAAYVGGKRNLSKRLIKLIENIPHKTYAEPFVGMGGVFLRRSNAPSCEVINDVSRDIVTLFRVMQRHLPQLIETMRYQITSRSEFERLVATDPDTLTDLERAGRLIYLQRLTFSGKPSKRIFSVSPGRYAPFNVNKLVPLLQAAHKRLAGVVIECLDWRDFISRYDRPSTLFYLDPPYWGCEDYYGKGVFARSDFERMAQELKELNGRFVMSLNDTPGVRDVFSGFQIESVQCRYSTSLYSTSREPDGRRIFNEVIITG